MTWIKQEVNLEFSSVRIVTVYKFFLCQHMTERNKNKKHTGQTRKMKPNTFLEAFCKTGTDPEGLKGLTKVTPKKFKIWQ